MLERLMLRLVWRRTRDWILGGLLLVSCWLPLAQPAQAGKAAKALTFDPTGSVEVISVYETSYTAQKSVAKSLKMPSKLMKKAVGFEGSTLLRSQDGKQVMTLSQWQDLASYQAYGAFPPAASGGATAPPEPTYSLAFELTAAQASFPGATPALRGKEAVVQLVQFTLKEPGDVSKLLPLIENLMAQRLEQQPIPQSILLLTGVEGDAIALLVNWNCSALFEDVGQPEEILIAPELAALADATQQLYTVANILPTEVKKPEGKDD